MIIFAYTSSLSRIQQICNDSYTKKTLCQSNSEWINTFFRYNRIFCLFLSNTCFTFPLFCRGGWRGGRVPVQRSLYYTIKFSIGIYSNITHRCRTAVQREGTTSETKLSRRVILDKARRASETYPQRNEELT